MTNDEIKEWLRDGEWMRYKGNADFIKRYPADDCEELCEEQKVLESLAAERKQNAECRRLMKKHEWSSGLGKNKKGERCPECYCIGVHVSTCLWAQAIGKGE